MKLKTRVAPGLGLSFSVLAISLFLYLKETRRRAADPGDELLVSELLGNDTDPVFEAAAAGDALRLSGLLLRGGHVQPPVGAGNRVKKTPLMVASERGHGSAVEVLLKFGADPDYVATRDDELWPPPQWTALCHARYGNALPTEQLLVKAGATPDPACLEEVAFVREVESRDLAKLEARGPRGAERFTRTVRGQALFKALAAKDLSLTRLVLSTVRLPSDSSALFTAIRDARLQGDWDTVHLLLEAGAPLPPLEELARGGDVALVQAALQRQGDPNARVEGYDTPLFSAVRGNHGDVARVLVAAGADVNARSLRDRTPLLEAARQGRSLLVQLLVEAGADVNLGKDPETPLRNAVEACDDESVRLLLRRGARGDLPFQRGGLLFERALRSLDRGEACGSERVLATLRALREGGVVIQEDGASDLDFLRSTMTTRPVFAPELRAAGLSETSPEDQRWEAGPRREHAEQRRLEAQRRRAQREEARDSRSRKPSSPVIHESGVIMPTVKLEGRFSQSRGDGAAPPKTAPPPGSPR